MIIVSSIIADMALGELPVAAAVPLAQLSQLPEQGKLLEPYALIKILSPHSAEER